ncbi:hypothetical protein I6G37_03570 [Serratia rubidaea]|nr:hypothetical protein I6G37_03570 [Serratia rubidaea]
MARKALLLILPLLLSGCWMGDKFPLYPAQASVVNSRVCVFVNQDDIAAKGEDVRRIAIWHNASGAYVYEKAYGDKLNKLSLTPGQCLPGIAEYNFVPEQGYSVTVNTAHNAYIANFVVSRQGEEITLKKR